MDFDWRRNWYWVVGGGALLALLLRRGSGASSPSDPLAGEKLSLWGQLTAAQMSADAQARQLAAQQAGQERLLGMQIAASERATAAQIDRERWYWYQAQPQDPQGYTPPIYGTPVALPPEILSDRGA